MTRILTLAALTALALGVLPMAQAQTTPMAPSMLATSLAQSLRAEGISLGTLQSLPVARLSEIKVALDSDISEGDKIHRIRSILAR